jgi:hypothetical protein
VKPLGNDLEVIARVKHDAWRVLGKGRAIHAVEKVPG